MIEDKIQETIIDAHIYNCPKYTLNNTIYDFTSFPFIRNVFFVVILYNRNKHINLYQLANHFTQYSEIFDLINLRKRIYHKKLDQLQYTAIS